LIKFDENKARDMWEIFFEEEGQFFLFIMAGESFFYENGSGPTYALRIIGSRLCVASTAPHLSTTREELLQFINLWALLRNVSLKPLVKDKIR
jgi:hypothetical protein